MTNLSPPPPIPPALVPFARRARALIVQGIARGGYARTATGGATGLHSSNAAAHDLAGALWASFASATEAERDTGFRTLWDASKAYADKRSMPDAKFALWCDDRDKAWHLDLLAVLVGDAPAPEVATPKASKDERIVQKYA